MAEREWFRCMIGSFVACLFLVVTAPVTAPFLGAGLWFAAMCTFLFAMVISGMKYALSDNHPKQKVSR